MDAEHDPARSSDSARVLPYMPRLLVSWLRSHPTEQAQRLPGSLVSVDVTGFTDLSNRLAALGKLGSEELTEVIGTTFERLLKVAYDHQGSLLKFGGDALLLFFTGDGHEVRACRSAVGMQRELRQLRRLESSVGPITLQMSMGLASGEVHFFLVGQTHRELILAGPTTSRAIALEAEASAGEILIDKATSKSLPPTVLGEKKGKGILLIAAPAGDFSVAPDETPRPGMDLVSAIPAALREEVVRGIGEGEHRAVTLAFVGYSGTDELIQKRGSADAAAALHEVVLAVQKAAARHGVTFLGSDAARDGGKLILCAGAPRAVAAAEERILLALSSLMAGRYRLPVRAGVHRGRVFAGHVGPPYRRTYTVMGDAVNLAARLMGSARPGQVVATKAVVDRSRTRFEVRVLEPLKLKGFAEPVEALAVGEVAGTREDVTEPTAMIGREEELAALHKIMKEVTSGQGAVVEIVAEPGMGKSRLLAEALKSADSFRTLTVACEPYSASTPYVPVRNLLSQLLGLSPGSGPDDIEQALRLTVERDAADLLPWVPLLGVPFGLELPPTRETASLESRFRKERLEIVIEGFLQRVISQQLFLIVEDIHWLDDASADVFRRLNNGVSTRPWLLCYTRDRSASPTSHDEGVHTIALLPLSAVESRALIEREGSAPLVPYRLAQLVERAGGNPLFLRELASAPTSDDQQLPDSVEVLVMERIDHLAPEDRLLLRYAAVLGSTFSETLVAEMLGFERAAISWINVSDFVEDTGDGRYRFKHALVRDAAYEGLPYRRRRSLHALAGNTIERTAGDRADEEAGVLALHFYEARDHDRAWMYSTLAGRRAEAMFANVEAARFLAQALAVGPKSSSVTATDLAEIHELLGDVLERLGQYEQAGRAYRIARRLVVDDPRRTAGMFYKQAWMAEKAGNYAQSLRWYRRGIDLLKDRTSPGEAGMRAQLLAGYGATRAEQGRFREAIEWTRKAIAEGEQVDEKPALGQAYHALHWALSELGEASEKPYDEMALSVYEELGDLLGQAMVLNNMGTYAYWKGRWDEARDLYDRGREAREKTGDEVSAADGINNVAEILSDQGRLEEAEEMFRHALRIWQSVDNRLGMAYAWSNLGRVAYRSGRHSEATALLEQARAEFAALGVRSQLLETDVRIAESLLLQGRWQEALELAQRIDKESSQQAGLLAQGPMLHRLQGLALLQAGNLANARHELEESLRQSRARQADYDLALTLQARASLAEREGMPADPGELEERLNILTRLGVLVPGG